MNKLKRRFLLKVKSHLKSLGVDKGKAEALSELQDSVENMMWLNQHYKILHNFAQICSKTLNEEILLKKTYEMVAEVMAADSFYLASYTEGEDQIKILLMVDEGVYFPPFTIEFGENNASIAIQSRQIIHHKVESDDKGKRYIVGSNETKSHIYVPIIFDDQVKGVISAQSFKEFAYRKEHEELLQIIGAQVLTSIETARLYEKIYLMSFTDDLTGLYNRGYFEKKLEKYMQEMNSEIAIVICDLDELKYVNDRYGHKAGDLLIQTTAAILKKFSSEKVITARLGGDEFALLIVDSSLEEVERMVDSIDKKVNSYKIESIAQTINMSIGFAYSPESINHVDKLFTVADKNMYQMKRQKKLELIKDVDREQS